MSGSVTEAAVPFIVFALAAIIGSFVGLLIALGLIYVAGWLSANCRYRRQ